MALKQEEKQLLLKDLCARLPYGVKVDVNFYSATKELSCDLIRDLFLDEKRLRPYLRPMSSMTEDEINEYENFITNEKDEQLRFCNELVFYNIHHFDYRGLIEKGLALPALEGMYNIKER